MSANQGLGTFLPIVLSRQGERSEQDTGYNTAQYESEKRTGIRRANGARKLKKLSNKHLAIIAQHLDGKSGEEIATTMRIRVVTVSRILNDPMVKQLTGRIFTDRQQELDALAGKAISVVRDGLNDGSMREKLSAVDKYAKLKDTIGTEESNAESVEDIVDRIFKGVSTENLNVQINVGDRNDR